MTKEHESANINPLIYPHTIICANVSGLKSISFTEIEDFLCKSNSSTEGTKMGEKHGTI